MKPLKDLTLLDRFLFAEVMENPEISQIMLEIILGYEVSVSEWAQAEKEIRISPLNRMARIDLYLKDREGNVYDAEVQKDNKGNLAHRSRFYGSMIDSKLMPPGVVDFNEMGDSYIIIISPFDLVKKGSYCYTFKMRCTEYPDYCLEDGSTRIFLNTRGKDEQSATPELIELLHYFERATGDWQEPIVSERVKRIHDYVQTVRLSEETGVKYMQLWEEMLMERQEGREEGRKFRNISLIRENSGQGMPLETIAAFLKLDVSIVKQICEAVELNPEVSDEDLIQMLPD